MYKGRERERNIDVCISLKTCKFRGVRNIQSFCSAFPSHFVFTLLPSQTTFEDDFSWDEWLGFTFLGVMEAR